MRGIVGLHDEIHGLRKALEWDPREFTEEELTGPSSTKDRTDERDDLLNRFWPR